MSKSCIDSITFTMDDGETVSIFLKEALAEIDENNCVNLQIPVFADGRSGHIYLTAQELAVTERTPMIKDATRWALISRTMNYKPRT